MPILFGVDIADEIATAFSGQLLTGTLTKVTSGTRTPGSLTGGTNPTTVDHTFTGFIEDKTEEREEGTLVSSGGRFVSVLGGSLPSGVEPTTGDKITIESTVYRIVEISGRDPAGAIYECKVEL